MKTQRKQPKAAAQQANPEQSKRFIDAAKAHGADETKEGADRVFKKVATAKGRWVKTGIAIGQSKKPVVKPGGGRGTK